MIAVTDWELLDLDEGAGDPTALSASTSTDWLPARVPGGVHEALVEAGRIADPLAGDTLADVRWIESRDWWFRGRFEVAADQLGVARIVAETLDTVAELWLDGERLGAHRNQFRPAAFDVDLATAGEHVLLVRLSPPLPEEHRSAADGLAGAARVAAGLRKASCSWGWDFAPRLPSIGIGAEVRVEQVGAARLTGHHLRTVSLSADRRRANLRLQAQIEGATEAGLAVTFALTAPDGTVHRATGDVIDGVAQARMTIDDPVLWWTHDLGDPALHDLTSTVLAGSGSGSDSSTATAAEPARELDRRSSQVGIRSIRLDRSIDEDGGGRRFQFVVNGVPTFARGANWVPPSPYVDTEDAALRRDLVARAQEGNLTMLRVWGGGIYERDAFYDACDELGILVWQDFMFACVRYPGDDPDFVHEVELEARHQVQRLRGRACLALWCGNNEIEALELIDRADGHPAREWGSGIFHTVLPAVVAELDPATPYWPGSPWGEPAESEVNGVDDGDRHAWEVWHGRVGAPFFTGEASELPAGGDARHWRRYADDTGRFISELGVLSAPDRGTIERWMPGATLHDAVFDAHLTDRPNDKVEQLLAVTTGLPADLDEYVVLTQAVQAEAMLFAIEHYRRQQARTAGALIWQLDDCWPAMSWSMLDVDGVPKPSYYAVARASAPLAVSIAATGDRWAEAWVVNNTPVRRRLVIDVEVGSFDGTGRTTTTVSATVAPGESRRVWADHVAPDAHRYVWASSPDDAFPPARLHFAELGELAVADGRIEWEVVGDGLRITSHGYGYGIRISHPVPRMRLSDNHFDLRDGETRLITVTGADPGTLEVTSTIPRGSGDHRSPR